MTQSPTDHTAPNDGIVMYELKSMWKQMTVHSFTVVYQHLFTRKDEFYEKFGQKKRCLGRDPHGISVQ